MSDRPDHKFETSSPERQASGKYDSFEVYPFKRLVSGKYDLDRWNDEYWARFSNMLKWTHERGIVVQIEVWDRFDYADHRGAKNWKLHPYNPANNVNYTSEDSGLATSYTKHHPSRDKQPFFHTIPAMAEYEKKYDVIRRYQERFVRKLLSHSLDYGHVLYCMNNETSTDPKWGRFWMAFIRREAAEKGVNVYVTDMFDDGYKPEQSAKIRQAIDSPQEYDFLDVSQVNSRNFDETHWEKLEWYERETRSHPRPLNNTKIYGSGNTSWGSGTPEDGVERFWRDIIAGCASARFHRNGAGNGLKSIAKASIQAARKVDTIVNWWDIEPRMVLLSDREKDEAYLAAKLGKQYVLYFTSGGSVGLDLRGHDFEYQLRWVDISTGRWGETKRIAGHRIVTIGAPGTGPWVAAIVRVRN